MSNVGPSGAPEVAYCGLVCAPVCNHAVEGCVGCEAGGGAEACRKRECCRERGHEGCWQCSSVPCAQGAFGDAAWRGLNVGCVELVKNMGVTAFAEIVVSRLGAGFDYGYLRYQTPEQIQAILRGEVEIPREDPDDV